MHQYSSPLENLEGCFLQTSVSGEPSGNVEAQRWGRPSCGRRVGHVFADGRNEGTSTFAVLVETIM